MESAKEIKDIWAHTGSWIKKPIGLRRFEKRLGDYLHWLRSRNLIRYTLFMTTYDDLDEEHFYLKEATCVTHYLLMGSAEEEYQLRNEEQCNQI